MEKILNELNMNIKEFAEHYEIPYNTVRQWINGTRTPPSYVLKLLKEKIEREKKGTQIKINFCYKCKEYENITGYSGNCKLEGIVYSSGTCKNFKKRN